MQQDGKDHQPVEKQDAVISRQPEERGRQQGIDEGLGVEQPAVFAPFQEQAHGADLKSFPDADDVGPGVLQVAVIGQALHDGKIGGFVGEKTAFFDLGQVGAQGEENDEQQGQDKKYRNGFWRHGRGHYSKIRGK